jgi:hypothetical protein
MGASNMTRLILTSLSGAGLMLSDFGDAVVIFDFRFMWGRLPSPAELAAYLGPHTGQAPADHWSTFGNWRDRSKPFKKVGFVEFCRQCETIELWFDFRPNDQLLLIWLLDFFRSHPDIVPRLRLRLVFFELIGVSKGFNDSKTPVVDVTDAELETASRAWQAYRTPTPEACLALLATDLSALPLLRPALLDLLAELPSDASGLGTTEMRMLELLAWGYANVNPLFHLSDLRRTYIFSEWEHGYLLDGLAFGPKPAIAGLDDALRTISREDLGKRHPAYLRSRLSLTEFGKKVVAHKEDFSRHNPIDRWWGGTHLTNDRLWRLRPELLKP